MSELKVEINGKEFEIPEEVFSLIFNISKERDNYFEQMKFLFDFVDGQKVKMPNINNVKELIELREKDIKNSTNKNDKNEECPRFFHGD